MAQSFFEQLQDRKMGVLRMAEKAAEYGWIPMKNDLGQNTISLQEIKEKVENDTLVIGVIGQMKCGKSTFLNSFVFEDDVLPAATTPMTAALSIITWGEKAKLAAEFYTRDEWEEQKYQAGRSLDEVNDDLDKSRVKAAKELVSRASRLGSTLDSLLGLTQEDDLSMLVEYVGADGKYVSITKAVTIYYPKEYLKGVEIVDTPGFNDPIVSREERTKEFLKRADVVLMMLYAGRPFDASDRDILFKNVRQCGIGKVLIGINKYDIPYCSETCPEDEAQIKAYVIEELRKACKECNDNTLNEILRDTEPIPLSAEMALLSQMPMTKISASEIFDDAWKRHCSNFGISTQAEMRAYSHLDDLATAIQTIVYKEKDKILFAKPINAIHAAGGHKKAEIEKELSLTRENIDTLLLPDYELDDREEAITKANRRMSKKIDSLGDDIESELRQITRKGKNELEDIVDASLQKMVSILKDNWPAYKGFEYVWPSIEAEFDALSTRKLKRATLEIAEQGKRKINTCTNQFFSDAEDLLMRFVPNFDSREFVKSLQNQIHMDIEEGELFRVDNTDTDTDDGIGLFDLVESFIDGASFGTFKAIGNLMTHSQEVSEKISYLNKIRAEFDPEPYLESAFRHKDEVINVIKQRFITELLEPLQNQISEIREKKDSKSTELEKLKNRKNTLEQSLSTITEQISQMEIIAEGAR